MNGLRLFEIRGLYGAPSNRLGLTWRLFSRNTVR